MALATDPFQSKMLRFFVKKKLGKDVGLIPILYDTLSTIDHLNPIIDPSSAYVKDFISIEDRESGWKRFKGTRGKNIDYKKYSKEE